jgi:hypothetical protein
MADDPIIPNEPNRPPPRPVHIAVATDGTVTVDGRVLPAGEDVMEFVRRIVGDRDVED